MKRRTPYSLSRRGFLKATGAGLAGASLAGLGLPKSAAAKDKLVVWWNKGYYKEEDQSMEKVAAAFAKENDVDTDLTFTTQTTWGRRSSAR